MLLDHSGSIHRRGRIRTACQHCSSSICVKCLKQHQKDTNEHLQVLHIQITSWYHFLGDWTLPIAYITGPTPWQNNFYMINVTDGRDSVCIQAVPELDRGELQIRSSLFWLVERYQVIEYVDTGVCREAKMTYENYSIDKRYKQSYGCSYTEYIKKIIDQLIKDTDFRNDDCTAGFLRMSNIAPHSLKAFDSTRHLLHQDIIFAPPGAHVLLKWTKTMQNRTEHQFIQIPQLDNPVLCPVKAIKNLINSRRPPSNAPLFAANSYPHLPVIDTKIGDALRQVLQTLGITLAGHGFHAFCHLGATLAFDNGVQLKYSPTCSSNHL